MFPWNDIFLCGEHAGGLCCSSCFEPYKDLFPEREAEHPGRGHCKNGFCGCHEKRKKEYDKHNLYIIEKTKEAAEKIMYQKLKEGWVFDNYYLSNDAHLAFRKLCSCDCNQPFARWTAHLKR